MTDRRKLALGKRKKRGKYRKEMEMEMDKEMDKGGGSKGVVAGFHEGSFSVNDWWWSVPLVFTAGLECEDTVND